MFKWKDRKYVNPRKKVFKNLDTGEILNLELQDDPNNILEESDTPMTDYCLNMAQDELVDDMSKTFTGTNITAETVKGTGITNKVRGFCKQETREGRNKFNVLDLSSANVSDIDFNNSSFKTSNTWGIAIMANDKVMQNLKPNTTYKMSAKVTLLSKPDDLTSSLNVNNILLSLYRANPYGAAKILQLSSNTERNEWQTNTAKQLTTTFTTPSDLTGYQMLSYNYYLDTGGQGSFKFENVMILEDTEIDETFEPHGASPSSNFPAKIHCLGDDKNLFNKDTTTDGKYINDEGILKSQETAIVSDYIEIKINKDFYVSGKKSTWVSYALYDKDKTFLSRIMTTTPNGILKVTNTNCKYIRMNLSPEDKDTLKLQEGTVATPWSPFGYGTTTNKSENRNILKSYKNTSFTPTDTSWYDLNGKSGLAGKGLASKTDCKFWVDKGKTYTVNIEQMANANPFQLCKDSETIINGRNNAGKITFVADFDGYVIPRVKAVQANVSTWIKNVMVCEGTEELDYVPHEEDEQVTYIKEPLCGVNDVYDEQDLSKGEIERNFAKKVLDGTETWHTGQDMGEVMRFYSSSLNLSKSISFGMSNYFKWLKHYTDNSEHFYIGSDGYLYIFIDKETCPDTASFKVWLSEHPVEIIYPLAEPIIEHIDCTDKIAQFDGQTTVYNVDGAEIECTLTNNRAIAQINQNLQKIEKMISSLKAGG